jgi:hypothetical protein
MISKLVKNLNNFAKTANSPKGILHNSKLLYALFIISLFNLVVFMSEKDYTSISTFLMNAMDDPDTIITADATFRYTYYDIEKLF